MSHGPQFGDKHQMQYLAQAGNLKFKSRQQKNLGTTESEKVAGPYKSGDFKKGRSADQHLP